MKRYWLFAGHNYYPSGGMEDFVGDFDSLKDAKHSVLPEIKRSAYHWAHVFDTETREIVWKEFT